MTLSVDIEARRGTFRLSADFRADSGVTALFGPSGAGKTTILRCIAGLEAPTSGSIVLDGQLLFDAASGVDVPARRRGVGYVFQEYALFPHLSVWQNVGFGLQDRTRAEKSAEIQRLLTTVGLEGFEERRPHELSGGQRQRVALARALAPGPDVLLLDEPFAAVDLRVRRTLREELLEIQQDTGIPMLIVTHDLAEVRALADSLVVVDRGRVVASGPREAVMAGPFDADLAELFSG